MIETNAQIFFVSIAIAFECAYICLFTLISAWFSDERKSFNLKETAFYFYICIYYFSRVRKFREVRKNLVFVDSN